MTKETFLDMRTHGFMRVAVAVPQVCPADPVRNARSHLQMLADLREKGAQYVLFPELGLSGYTPGDLFLNDVTQESSLEALRFVVNAVSGWDVKVLFTVGLPLVIGDNVFNVAVTLYGGIILGVTPKTYLPNYREFYEGRHFASARETDIASVDLLGQPDIPFGANILIRHRQNPAFVLHTEICEDIWVPIPPSSKAALAGATVLANLSASNITVGKADYREQLVVNSSGKNLAVQMYSAAGFGESTTDLAWDGDGYIADRGESLARTKRFSLKGTSIVSDVNLKVLILDRMRQNSFRQNAKDNSGTCWQECHLDGPLGLGVAKEGNPTPPNPVYFRFERRINPHPFVPSDPPKRDERCYEVFHIQATSLAKRLLSLPEHLRKVCLGVSGGQDSTHALNVAVHAMDLLGLPRTNVIALTMPGFGTTPRTYQNALALMKALKVDSREISIKSLAGEMLKSVGHHPETRDLTYENVQAWSRKFTELASVCGAGIVLGTGDLSELALGWCTMFGDHASHYGINAGVPKTLISFLIKWTAEVIFKDEPETQKVLLDILATPISPELLPGQEGEITQKTEDFIGPYELHDFFLYHFVRFGSKPSVIVRMALEAFGGKYAIQEIKKWFKVFLTRFFATQVKRSCLPDGPKVGLACLSPRGDWRMPSDLKPDAWLNELEKNVPDEL